MLKAIMFWKECENFSKRQDAFWVQCPSNEMESKILPYLSLEQKEELNRENQYISTWWVKVNPGLLVETDSYYILVSSDMKELFITDPYYPYASLWNAYNPFRVIKPVVFDTLNEIVNIKAEFIDAYSSPKLPVIPVINCHPQNAGFRSKAATFGRNWWQETTGIRS